MGSSTEVKLIITTMKFIVALPALSCVALSSAESELQVTVTKADFNRATMDRFCCLIAQSQCTTQCAGQDCAATCTGRCGLFGLVTCDPTPALESPLTHAQPPQHKLYWQQTLSVIINWKKNWGTLKKKKK